MTVGTQIRTMKALSLWQPWASLIAIGAKTIETRHWSTTYRGPLAIHAAKHIEPDLPDYFGPFWCLVDKGGCLIREGGTGPMMADHPLGAVVATCELVDVVPMGWKEGAPVILDLDGGRFLRNGGHVPGWSGQETQARNDHLHTQYAYGDFRLGRFAWVLENIRAIEPVPAVGHQGLWSWSGGTSDD